MTYLDPIFIETPIPKHCPDVSPETWLLEGSLEETLKAHGTWELPGEPVACNYGDYFGPFMVGRVAYYFRLLGVSGPYSWAYKPACTWDKL